MRVLKCLFVASAVMLALPLAASAAGPVTDNMITLGQPEIAAAADHPVGRIVIVPISIDNTQPLVGMDIPLSFGQPGDGIELLGVTYSSRVSYFDEKITNIDNNRKTVDMGLISMAYNPTTPDLEIGSGEIARLTFNVTDPTMTEFTIAATQLENPHHRLIWVYNEWHDGRPSAQAIEPVFAPVVVQIAGGGGGMIPERFALEQNYPNPFNAGTVIRFAVPEEGKVRVAVYNVLGQAVRTLADQVFPAGFQEVTWDGRTESGAVAPSGVYFYRIQAHNYTDTRKMTLLK